MKVAIAKFGLFRLSYFGQLWLDNHGFTFHKFDASRYFRFGAEEEKARSLYKDHRIATHSLNPLIRFDPSQKFVYAPYLPPHELLRAHPSLVTCIETFGPLAQEHCHLAVVDVPRGSRWWVSNDEVGEYIEQPKARVYA